MKKIFMHFFGLMLFVALTCGICTIFNNKIDNQTELNNVNAFELSSVALTNDNLGIIEEVCDDGLVSYLTISLPTANTTSIETFKITQTFGNFSSTITKDELNNNCYFENSTGISKPVTKFYFTTPAIYTVSYVINSGAIGEISVANEESYQFAPSVNQNKIKEIYTTSTNETKNYIKISKNNDFYITSAGILEFPMATELPTEEQKLYTITAYTEIDGTKYESNPLDPVNISNLLTLIPDNSYGKVVYRYTSNIGFYVEIPITINTSKFDFVFKDYQGNIIDSQTHKFVGGYIFNESINLIVYQNNELKNLVGENLQDTLKEELFNSINFQLHCEDRNETNTQTTKNYVLNLKKSNNQLSSSIQLNESDHTIYTLKCFTNDNTNTEINDNVCKLKIITKVPKLENDSYLFNITVGQGNSTSSNNYLNALNGYIKTGTKIFNAQAATRILNNSTLNNLCYGYNLTEFDINNIGKIFTTNTTSTADEQIIGNNEVFYLRNKTDNFNNAYCFYLAISTYNSTSFRDLMIKGQFYINGVLQPEQNYSTDTNQDILNPIESFKYIVPSNYSLVGIPTKIRLTYNGTSFDNIFDLADNSQLEFTKPGIYSIEFYNTPTYSFLKDNIINQSGQTLHYYKVSFKISGSYFYGNTTNSDGNIITVSNNLYTSNPVNFEANLTNGQKLTVYKNNIPATVYDSETALVHKFTISDVGTWKLIVTDTDNSVQNSLVFCIIDKLYQGFSITNKDEYEIFDVYHQTAPSPTLSYEQLESSNAYHITESGVYKIVMTTKENYNFTANGGLVRVNTLNSNELQFEIKKSFFEIDFENVANGSKTKDKITITKVGGVELTRLDVYKSNKLVKTYTADELSDWETVTSNTFSDYGKYTFKLTDKYGNSYEAQVQRYYKVNVALVLLILLGIAAIITLIVIIYKSRVKVKVK